MIIVVHLSVTGVSGNDLTSRHKAPYLWLLTKGSYNYAVSVSTSQGTSYRHKL